MALGFSTADIVRFKHQADRVSNKARAIIKRSEETLSTVGTGLETSAAGFLCGLAQGKYGAIALGGVPVEVLAGLAIHVAAFTGIAGKNAHHLHAIGNGVLTVGAASLGRMVGAKFQTPADRARIAGSSMMGALDGGTTGGASLADEELARMVAAGRR